MAKKKLVVLTGAGISAESGLRTFRDSDGLWEGYQVTDVATPEAWYANPGLVLDFYNFRRRDVQAAQPNAAHHGLAALEKDFDVCIITQNIDDLHERAGSSRIIHLHGEIFRMCSEIDKEQTYEIYEDMTLGQLAPDGHQLRPAIVWFGEAVPMMGVALQQVLQADIFLVVGTSLVVYPAASLLEYAAPAIPKFIIDKRIPHTTSIHNLTAIEKTATEGMADLTAHLKKLAG